MADSRARLMLLAKARAKRMEMEQADTSPADTSTGNQDGGKKPYTPSMVEKGEGLALRGAQVVGTQLDRLGPAPLRGAINAAQESDWHNPLRTLGDMAGGAWKGAIHPDQVPTGKELFANAGYSTAPTRSGGQYRGTYGIPGTSYQSKSESEMNGPSVAGMMGAALDVVSPMAGPLALAKGGLKTLGAMGKVAGKTGPALNDAVKAADVVVGNRVFEPTTKAVGGLIRGATETVGDVVRAEKAAAAPVYAKTRAKDLTTFERNGLNPADIETAGNKFGPSHAITREAKADMQHPSYGAEKAAEHDEKIFKVKDALQRDISRIGGKGGDMTPATAGEFIRDSFDEAEQKLFEQNHVRYSSIAEMPGMKIEPKESVKLLKSLGKMKYEASKRAALSGSGATISAANSTVKAIEGIENTLKYSPFDPKAFVFNMQTIGNDAYKAANKLDLTPVDVKEMRDIYSQMTDAFKGSVKNPTLKAELKLSNDNIKKFLDKKKHVAGVIGNEMTDAENVYHNVMNSTNKIDALKEIFTPEQMQVLKGAFLKNLENPEAGFLAWKRKLYGKRDQVQRLFKGAEAGGEGELQNFNDLLDAGERMGSSVSPGSSAMAAKVMHTIKDLPLKAVNRTRLNAIEAKAAENAKPPSTAPKTLSQLSVDKRKTLDKAGYGPAKKTLQMMGEHRDKDEK